MTQKLVVSGRDSVLSKAQIECFVQHIATIGIESQIQHVKTFGDKNTQHPIHNLAITNPFVKEIHQSLIEGKSHIGISSLKDVEITNLKSEIETIYFSPRKNPRDTLLLSKSAINKIKNGKKITVGTSSLRRAFLLKKHLLKILPHNTSFEIVEIRGNITTRLAMLNSSCDSIVIAVAGIVRLYEHEKCRAEVQMLLSGVKSILLPISHFPTPPGQGVVIAQIAKNGINENIKTQILGLSSNLSMVQSCIEKAEFSNYGAGCRQAYGVTHIEHKGHQCTFISGMNSDGKTLSEYKNFKEPPKFKTFCDTRTLTNTFKVKHLEFQIPTNAKKFIVSNIKSITSNALIKILQHAEEVWAAGFETMTKLASMGVMCTGCLESCGVDAMPELYFSTNFAHNPHEYYIFTYKGARDFDTQFHKIYTYELILNEDTSEIETFKEKLQKCDAVFWSSINHYELLKSNFKSDIHITLLGNTYNHLLAENIQPHGFFNHKHLDFYLQQCHNTQP